MEVKDTLCCAKADLFMSQSGNPTTTFFVYGCRCTSVLGSNRAGSAGEWREHSMITPDSRTRTEVNVTTSASSPGLLLDEMPYEVGLYWVASIHVTGSVVESQPL